MYIPSQFAVADAPTLHEFIRANGFGALVANVSGRLTASHLPFILDETSLGECTLLGHMARANEQWRDADGTEVLVVFSGTHAYISPTWYEAKNVVPTWNYLCVHVQGRLQLIEERQEILRILEQTVNHFESHRPLPWRMESNDAAFNERLVSGVAAFAIEIERIEGAWKLSQHHSVERRSKVIDGLRAAGGDHQRQIADAMERTIADDA